MNPRRPAPSECPVCGAAVPPAAKACPDCGADERAGWDEEAAAQDGLDLPDHAYAEDRPEKSPGRGQGRPVLIAIVAVGLLGALLFGLLRGLFG